MPALKRYIMARGEGKQIKNWEKKLGKHVPHTKDELWAQAIELRSEAIALAIKDKREFKVISSIIIFFLIILVLLY